MRHERTVLKISEILKDMVAAESFYFDDASREMTPLQFFLDNYL